jgi:hypothetical protein
MMKKACIDDRVSEINGWPMRPLAFVPYAEDIVPMRGATAGAAELQQLRCRPSATSLTNNIKDIRTAVPMGVLFTFLPNFS